MDIQATSHGYQAENHESGPEPPDVIAVAIGEPYFPQDSILSPTLPDTPFQEESHDGALLIDSVQLMNNDASEAQRSTSSEASSDLASAEIPASSSGLGVAAANNAPIPSIYIQQTLPSAECVAPDEGSASGFSRQESEILANLERTSRIQYNVEHEYSGINRKTLSDDLYIQAQHLDLERLTLLEIDANDELEHFENYLHAELTSQSLYDGELAKNQRLKELLRRHRENAD